MKCSDGRTEQKRVSNCQTSGFNMRYNNMGKAELRTLILIFKRTGSFLTILMRKKKGKKEATCIHPAHKNTKLLSTDTRCWHVALLSLKACCGLATLPL